MVTRLRLLSLAAVAAAGLSSLFAASRLPEVMAVHWNAAGVADGFAPRAQALAMMPVVMLALLLLFAVLPRVSPKGYSLEPMRPLYEGMVFAVELFLLAVHFIVLAAAAGAPLAIERVVPATVSLLFVALGALMFDATPNFFVGVRTPWTLSSKEVWRATHRFAGRLFVFGGAVLAVLAALKAPLPLVMGGFVSLGLLPVGYSLWAWRRLGSP